jgi:hypothetical protein
MPRGHSHSFKGGAGAAAASATVGKKCIPGLFCIENMTLFLLVVMFILIAYLYYVHFVKPVDQRLYVVNNGVSLAKTVDHGMRDALSDPYFPPVKYGDALLAHMYYPNPALGVGFGVGLSRSYSSGGDVRGPILMPGVGAIPTRTFSTEYSQVGILTREQSRDAKFDSDKLIVPLMGRQVDTGRSKWQYYSISNSGNLNTKLPIRIRGKNCSGEYGCDEVSDGDEIYVQGYDDVFRATVYETGSFAYRPY